MKSTQDLYISVLKEETSPSEFLFQVRKDPRFKQFITPLQSYNDTITTLKSKGFINEIFIDDEGNVIDDEEPIDPEQKYGGNTGWKAFNRLEKGEGDDLDDAIVKTYSGIADDALDPRRSFSLNEDTESYTLAFNSIIDQLRQGSGNDETEVSHMIDVAVAEFDLSEEEEKKLRVDVFDWRNQESGTEYEGDDLDENEYCGPGDEEDYEGTGFDENYLPGGIGDTTSENSVDRSQLEKGIHIEMEHTNDPKIAKEIALDHLTEDPQYYSKLSKAHLQESANPKHLNDNKKEYPQFDNLRLNQLLGGARYEFELSGKKDWEKSYTKAGNNLLKDPLYYVNKINNLKKNRKRSDLMVPVKGNNLVDKKNGTVKAPNKESKQSRLKKGPKTEVVKKQKIEVMTQKPKKVSGVKVMSIPGKEKKVKLNESKLDKFKLQNLAKLIKEQVEDYLKKKINEKTPSPVEAMKNIAKGLVQHGYKKDQIMDCLIGLRQGDETKYNELNSKLPQNSVDIDSLYKISMNECSCQDPKKKIKEASVERAPTIKHPNIKIDFNNLKKGQKVVVGTGEERVQEQGIIINITPNSIIVKDSYGEVLEFDKQGNSNDSNFKILTLAENLNEDHLHTKEEQIQYILQHKDIIRQKDQITPEYLESLTDNYINKLYLAVEAKVRENDSLGGSEPEFNQLQENQDILTEEEIQLQEVKGLEIEPGKTFDMQGDLGKFKKGEKVTCTNVQTVGQEIQFTLKNESGEEDTFIMDINDKFDDKI